MRRFRIHKHDRPVAGRSWRASYAPHEMEFVFFTHAEAIAWTDQVIKANRHPALAA